MVQNSFEHFDADVGRYNHSLAESLVNTLSFL